MQKTIENWLFGANVKEAVIKLTEIPCALTTLSKSWLLTDLDTVVPRISSCGWVLIARANVDRRFPDRVTVLGRVTGL